MKGAHKWAEFTRIYYFLRLVTDTLLQTLRKIMGMLPELGHSFSETKETEGGSPDAASNGTGGITRCRRPERKPRRMTWDQMGVLRHFRRIRKDRQGD
jgi:hypothetical protein